MTQEASTLPALHGTTPSAQCPAGNSVLVHSLIRTMAASVLALFLLFLALIAPSQAQTQAPRITLDRVGR